jgi:hypothetical protein
MIANAIIESYDSWDEIDVDCFYFYGVVLKPEYRFMLPDRDAQHKYCLYANGESGILEVINDNTNNSNCFKISNITFEKVE